MESILEAQLAGKLREDPLSAIKAAIRFFEEDFGNEPGSYTQKLIHRQLKRWELESPANKKMLRKHLPKDAWIFFSLRR